MPNRVQLLFILLMCARPSLRVAAQVLDTTEYSSELSTYYDEESLVPPARSLENDSRLKNEDTSFVMDYLLDGYRMHATYHMDLGPIATPSLSFQQRMAVHSSFDLGYHTLDSYQSDPRKTKYYRSATPRTLLKYSQGSRDLLYLRAEHSQKISDLWVVGLDYERIKSNNIYFGNLNSFTNLKIPNSYNTKFYSHFNSPNKRYELLFNAYLDKNTLTETGGISDRNHFDTLQGREKQYFNFANVIDASNTIKHNGVYVKQYYRLGNYPAPTITYDTINKDSIIDVKIESDSFAIGSITHTFEYVKSHQLFEDNNPNMEYFPDRLLGASTLDSVQHNMISNTIGIDLMWPIRPVLSLTHSFHKIDQNGLMKFSFHNVEARGYFQRYFSDLFLLSLDVKRHFSGYNAGDQYQTLGFKTKRVKISLSNSLYRPSYTSNYFVSNNYYWYNNFEKSSVQKLDLHLKISKRFTVEARHYNLKNWVIYNENARPKQIGTAFTVTNFKVKHWLTVGHWNLRSQVEYNISEESSLPMPRFAIKESFFYENILFRRTMPAQIGFDVYYQDEYDGLTYNPAIRQFHLSPGNQIGGYPLVDVFFTAKVGGFKMFGIIQHVTEELFGNDYYSAANYPINPFSFRFGIEWRLFD